MNLLLDVGFNREVGEDTAFYWTKEAGNLAALIEETDKLTEEERNALSRLAKQRISAAYSQEKIADAYEKILGV